MFVNLDINYNEKKVLKIYIDLMSKYVLKFRHELKSS